VQNETSSLKRTVLRLLITTSDMSAEVFGMTRSNTPTFPFCFFKMSKTKLFIAGHNGMVGSALVRAAQRSGTFELITAGRRELDLTCHAATQSFISRQKPEIVILAAAKVGGIYANSTQSADFLYDNLAISTNVIHSSYLAGVRRLLFLGSSCIYPKFAEQPIKEKSLLTGELESTNEAYAVAKIAGLKLCSHYRKQYKCIFHSAMPTNLYGVGDNYHPQNSHVIPGLIHRFHEAKCAGLSEVVIWGSGKPLREFLYVDDLASACMHLLSLSDPPDWVNVGSGRELTIMELAGLVAKTVGYSGTIRLDSEKPDGTPRKLLDSSALFATGWRPIVTLEDGLVSAYSEYLSSKEAGTLRSV
jgi:GDP-L-fucose synthase